VENYIGIFLLDVGYTVVYYFVTPKKNTRNTGERERALLMWIQEGEVDDSPHVRCTENSVRSLKI